MSTTRTLILLRHAKAEGAAASDDQRQLAERGRADAAAVGALLEDTGFEPDLVLCSSAVRTRETLEGVREGGLAVASDGVRYDDRIYNAEIDELLACLGEVADDVTQVLVIGHAPGIPDLAEHLADPRRSDNGAREVLSSGFPTSAFAVLAVPGSWAELADVEAARGAAQLMLVTAARA